MHKYLSMVATAIITLFLVAPATATSVVQPTPKPEACLVKQSEFKTYAKAVYVRSTVSRKATSKMDRMRDCASSRKASKNMLVFQRKQSQARQLRLAAYCGSQACNRRLAKILADKRYGPGGFACIDGIISRESKYLTQVYNMAGSGAYGIPQALPGSKMASHGADWATNPATQLRWMFTYVDGRYGGPCAALGFWRANRYY